MLTLKLTISRIIVPTALLISCSSTKPIQKMVKKEPEFNSRVANDQFNTDLFIENLLKQYPSRFDSILKNRVDWNVQVIYTSIDRKNDGSSRLTNHYFNMDSPRYFYPASMVKLPVTMLALQRLNELKEKGIDKNTAMITESADKSQTMVFNDPTTKDGRPSIAHYIKKILMVSDNDAYNRLYEFLGQDYINNELHKKGYTGAQLLHRLSISLSEEENRHTNPVKFMDSNNKLVYAQNAQWNKTVYPVRNDFIGKGFYRDDQLVIGPMNFSKKNRISLADLHNILISLVFPEKFSASQRFNITVEDRRFMLKYMSQLPTESKYPPYAADTINYWPAYCKFLFAGAAKGKFPENIRIFNKVGDAYGQMIDVAYIVDFKNKVEFFLSAAIYCNTDGILNDDKYDYDTIGLPFLKQLGQVIYEYELKRERPVKPDLSAFIFDYDK